MVRQPRELVGGFQRANDRRVHQPATVRRCRALDGEPGELVPERDPVAVCHEHSRVEAGAEQVELGRRHGLQQPQLSPRRDHRDNLEQPARLRLQSRGTGEHRITNRLGQRAAAGGEDLGDVEGVPLREPVNRVGVGAMRLRELPHCVEGEPRHGQPRDRTCGRELAEDDAEGMVARNLVVPVGGDHERLRPVDAPAKHA